MMTLRRVFVTLLALAVAAPSHAVSLYKGATRSAPVVTAPLTGVSVPQLPGLPGVLPGVLPGQAVSLPAIPALPAAPAASAAAPLAPMAAALAVPAATASRPAGPLAADAAGAAVPATALGQAERTGAAVSAAQADGASASGPLAAAFDGTQRGGGDSQPPSVPPSAQDPDGLEGFISAASKLFHPALQGQAPAVAARTVPAATTEGTVPSDDDMLARMQLSPLTNPEREAAVIKLYQLGGAAAGVVDVARGQAPDLTLYDTIQRQDAGRGRHNLIVVKKGRTDRVVVVGGHHDKVSEGAGTIDNWTGSTMVTNLYQAMKDVDTEATFVFVAFAREEEGLIGSEEFARSLGRQTLARVDSMINLDTLGVDGTFSWKNNSTRSLLDMIKRVAAVEKRDLTEALLNGGDADSSTFRRLGIAAMTIFGASQDVIFDIIHSASDNMAAFSLTHYRNAYLLTLALLKHLDRNPVKPAGTI